MSGQLSTGLSGSSVAEDREAGAEWGYARSCVSVRSGRVIAHDLPRQLVEAHIADLRREAELELLRQLVPPRQAASGWARSRGNG